MTQTDNSHGQDPKEIDHEGIEAAQRLQKETMGAQHPVQGNFGTSILIMMKPGKW